MTTLLLFHILFMSLSIITTIVIAIGSMLSFHVTQRVLATNTVITLMGLSFGAVLLFQHPINYKCAVLLTYLVAFVGLHLYAARTNQRLSAGSTS